MKKFLLLVVASLLALGTLALAQSDWKAPAKAKTRKNPLAGKPQLAAGGEKLYYDSCSVCHMDPKKGQRGLGPNLSDKDVKEQTDGELFWKITNGNTESGMPSFSNLPENQRWQIILFLRQVGEQAKK